MESSKGKKSSIRRITKKDGSLTSELRTIMNELRSFYAELYQDNPSENCDSLIDSFIGNLHLPKLTLDQRNRCDEKLTVGKCFSSLKTFQKNKTPGNDGLTVEFY